MRWKNRYCASLFFLFSIPAFCLPIQQELFLDKNIQNALSISRVKSIRIILTTPGLTTRSSLSEDSLPKIGCAYESSDSDVIKNVQALILKNIKSAKSVDIDRIDLRNGIYFMKENGSTSKILMNDFSNSEWISAKIKTEDADGPAWIRKKMHRDLRTLIGNYPNKFMSTGTNCASIWEDIKQERK